MIPWIKKLFGNGSAKSATEVIPQTETPSILEINSAIRIELARMMADGESKRRDPYWSSSYAHNVGNDIIEATRLATMTLNSLAQGDAIPAIQTALAELDNAMKTYRITENDPAGYGIGTLREFKQFLGKLDQAYENARFSSSIAAKLLPPASLINTLIWRREYFNECSPNLRALLQAYENRSLPKVIIAANALQQEASDPNWLLRLNLLILRCHMRDTDSSDEHKPTYDARVKSLRQIYDGLTAGHLIKCILGEMSYDNLGLFYGRSEQNILAIGSYYLGSHALSSQHLQEAREHFERCIACQVACPESYFAHCERRWLN
jgi:hypothetical protein